MKNKWRNYALKGGKVKESYIREYCNRSKARKTSEASSSDSLCESRKNKEEVKGSNYESIREKDIAETHQQGQQRIQESAEGRPRAEEENTIKQTKGEKIMAKEKMSPKEKKHEAKEGKRYEKLEDKREAKKEAKKKK